MATIYRKYRPQVFGEVFGQEHVLETLSKALKLNRVAHAYLFTGARGVGKTTVARLMAKAVNCLDETNRPCGKCSSCQAISENRFIDLIEIDAASNRGIDEIRELRDKIQFSPSIGKKRVYIIDEIHMLTREAFNALLKTLEEPPEHTIFIFATTEVHKVPVTVLSRCQRFDFRLASEDLIVESLEKIAKKEGFKIDDKVVKLLARSSGGSFRDAQSLLDQLSSHLLGDGLSYDQALEILNLSSVQEIDDFIKVLEENKPKKAIDFIVRLKDKGISFPDFLAQLVVEIRRRLIEKIKNDGDSTWESEVLERLIRAASDMKFSPVESLPLELAACEICFKETQESIRQPEDKNQNDNTKLKNEDTQKKPKLEPIDQSVKNEKSKISNEQRRLIPINQDIKRSVVMEVSAKNKTLGSLLADLSWGGDSNEVKIYSPYSFHKDKIMDKKNLLLLENCLETVLQCKSKVTCEIRKDEDIANEIDDVFGE